MCHHEDTADRFYVAETNITETFAARDALERALGMSKTLVKKSREMDAKSESTPKRQKWLCPIEEDDGGAVATAAVEEHRDEPLQTDPQGRPHQAPSSQLTVEEITEKLKWLEDQSSSDSDRLVTDEPDKVDLGKKLRINNNKKYCKTCFFHYRVLLHWPKVLKRGREIRYKSIFRNHYKSQLYQL